jgi:transposase
MQEQTQVIGVDVAKAQLVTAVHGSRPLGKAVSNDSVSIMAWLDTLSPGCIIAMESTGKHHRLLAQLAHAAGMCVFVLNARDVYYYAQALSGRSKTDRLDAAIIARYAAEHHDKLHVWQPPRGVEQQLQDLLRRRAEVVRLGVSLKQTLSDVSTLQEAYRELQASFDRFFKELDQQLAVLVASDELLQQGVTRLRTITGFGPQSSILLAALFSRIDFANVDALVAYSGLDPRACDSGMKRGKRKLSKRGPAILRRQLYLVAFAASHSKALKPFYQSIKAKGFATTQALVILARKLLRAAFAVWKSGKPFDIDRFALQTT